MLERGRGKEITTAMMTRKETADEGGDAARTSPDIQHRKEKGNGNMSGNGSKYETRGGRREDAQKVMAMIQNGKRGSRRAISTIKDGTGMIAKKVTISHVGRRNQSTNTGGGDRTQSRLLSHTHRIDARRNLVVDLFLARHPLL